MLYAVHKVEKSQTGTALTEQQRPMCIYPAHNSNHSTERKVRGLFTGEESEVQGETHKDVQGQSGQHHQGHSTVSLPASTGAKLSLYSKGWSQSTQCLWISENIVSQAIEPY